MSSVRRRIRDARYPGSSSIGQEEMDAVMRVVEAGSLFRYYGTSEPVEVDAYEREWEAHLGVRHVLAVNSGTSALLCALVAAGVGAGDEVIIPAFAWVSVPNAVIQAGAIPVVVDVDDGLTLDPEAVSAALTERTAAILPVHMRGAPAALDRLLALGSAPVVEDACQAAGTTYRGRPAGSFGLVGAFSTQYAKLVSTGEGGVVATDDPDCYRAALDAHDPANALRRGEEPSAYPGMNLRCTELQAAVGRVQLQRLPEHVERLRRHSARIEAAISSIPGLQLREKHDADGSNGVAAIYFAPSGETARSHRDWLVESGVSATTLHEPGVVDLHVSSSWRTVTAALERAGRRPSACARSLALLERAVQIDVHPLYDDADVDAICEAILDLRV